MLLFANKMSDAAAGNRRTSRHHSLFPSKFRMARLPSHKIIESHQTVRRFLNELGTMPSHKNRAFESFRGTPNRGSAASHVSDKGSVRATMLPIRGDKANPQIRTNEKNAEGGN